MNRFGTRVLIVLLLVSFGVFYGVDLATRGTERIHGPLAHENETAQHHDEQEPLPVEDVPLEDEGEPALPEPPHLDPAALSDQGKWALRIGQVLQKIAHRIVESVVSIYETFLEA